MNLKKHNGAIKNINTGDNKIYFIRRLYELIENGYTLEDSLHFILLQYEIDNTIIENIKTKLSNGNRLSDILKYLGYSTLIVSKMAFAENYGKIEDMLLEIETYLILKNKQKEKVIKTIRYPLFLTLALFALIMVFNMLVIPQFENIYSSSNITMDIQTIILIKILYYLPKIISLFFIIVMLLISYIIFSYKYKEQLFLATIKYIPFANKFFRLYFSYKFSQELSLFLMSGFSLKTSLEVMSQEKYDYYLAKISKDILDELTNGISFEEAISKIKIFENTMEKFISHGKTNGMLDKQLKLYSNLMLDGLLTLIDKKLKKLQPILFAILSVVIVGLYLVILLPIFNMASTLK